MDQLEKALEDMTKEDLVEAYNVVRAKRGLDPLEGYQGSREKLVGKIERAERKRRVEQEAATLVRSKAQPRKPKPPKRGVGGYVRELLMEVVGTTPDGQFPVGLAYEVIVKRARKRFRQSRVNAKHVRWYCTKMREHGLQPPVWRGRSKWAEGERG